MIESPLIANLPVLPVKRTVLFPGILMPLTVGRPRSVAAVEAAIKTEDKTILVVAQRDAQTEEPTLEDLHAIGTKAVIKQTARGPEGQLNVLIQGLERVVLLKLEQRTLYDCPRATSSCSHRHRERGRCVASCDPGYCRRPSQVDSTPGIQEATVALGAENDPVTLAYRIASLLNLTLDEEQQLLESSSREDILRSLYAALSREVQILQLRDKIASDAQEKIGKSQREYILREQLKAIQDELGEPNSEGSEVDALKNQIEKADLPDHVRKEAQRELGRLGKTPPSSPDHQVIRTYLEFVLELPWKTVRRSSGIGPRSEVLDEDHYGIQEVKERIVEHLAVLKLNPPAKAPILCFVGPPGVGKTSLGQSIARSMGRKFERLSLGGLHDEAELRGHRRTYVSAMPGRIMQALRRAGAKNPVLMLDEVDKVGQDFRGDPAAALLEILDPEQNHTFRDNYLDLPFDLSKVMFITTANSLDTISRPFLDRMEIIRLAGYSQKEKLEIAMRYLWPRRLEEAGLESEQLDLPQVIQYIISRYTREAGVRQLEQMLGRLTRKVAMRLAEHLTEALEGLSIHQEDLDEWLGMERFMPEEARKQLPLGVATGMAWTPAGGDVLYIETTLLPGRHDLTITGHIGDVMQESAHAARSYLWSHAETMGFDISRFKQSGMHIHVPSGAIPKDGPSAGITMASALASVYSGNPVRTDTAMTGEISLSGLVLPVGGIKEKMLAAHRAGLKRIILPKSNEKDLKEIPEEVRQDLQFILVQTVHEVLQSAFESRPDGGAEPQNVEGQSVPQVTAATP